MQIGKPLQSKAAMTPRICACRPRLSSTPRRMKLRGRRLRQPPRHRVRRRYRPVQTALGAYGHKPDDTILPYKPAIRRPAVPQSGALRHAVQRRLVVFCDAERPDSGFKPDGTFVKEVFIEKETLGSGSVFDIAFSQDPQQKYMYVADGENNQVHILDRQSLRF